MGKDQCKYYAVWLDGVLYCSGLNRRAIQVEADGWDNMVLMYEPIGGKKAIKPIAYLKTAQAVQNVAKQAAMSKGDNNDGTCRS